MATKKTTAKTTKTAAAKTPTKAQLEQQVKVQEQEKHALEDEINWLKANLANYQDELEVAYAKAKTRFYADPRFAGMAGLVIGGVIGAVLF